MITIGVALLLVVIGALGTFGDVFSDRVGAWTHVAASGVLILGVLFRRI